MRVVFPALESCELFRPRGPYVHLFRGDLHASLDRGLIIKALVKAGVTERAERLALDWFRENHEVPTWEPALSTVIELIEARQYPAEHTLRIVQGLLGSEKGRAQVAKMAAAGGMIPCKSLEEQKRLLRDERVRDAVIAVSNRQEELLRSLAEDCDSDCTWKVKQWRRYGNGNWLEIVHFSDIHLDEPAMSAIEEIPGDTLSDCISVVTGDFDDWKARFADKPGRARRCIEALRQRGVVLWVPGNHDGRPFVQEVFNGCENGTDVEYQAPWSRVFGDLLFLGLDADPMQHQPSRWDLQHHLVQAIRRAALNECGAVKGIVVLSHFHIHEHAMCRESLSSLTRGRPTLVLCGHEHQEHHTFSKVGEGDLGKSHVVSGKRTRGRKRTVAHRILWDGREFSCVADLCIDERSKWSRPASCWRAHSEARADAERARSEVRRSFLASGGFAAQIAERKARQSRETTAELERKVRRNRERIAELEKQIAEARATLAEGEE